MEVYLVSRCCGDEFEEIENEHGDLKEVCIACGDYCEVQNDYDYRELKLYDLAEAREDERRDLGL